MSAAKIVETALSLARARLAEGPSFPLYESIVKQLEYVAAVLDGKERDRSRLKEVIVGRYGAMEFETSDPEFANALMEVQSIVLKMAKGLKV